MRFFTIIGLLGFIILSHKVHGQKKMYTIVNRFCRCPEFKFSDSKGFHLKDIANSPNDLEIRFQTTRLGAYISLAVLSRKKDSYKLDVYLRRIVDFEPHVWPDSVKNIRNWERHPWRKYTIQGKDLAAMVTKLQENNIFSLPSQATIVKDRGFSLPYEVETKLNGTTRMYNFGWSSEYQDLMPKHRELRNYKAIVEVFHEVLVEFKDEFKSILKE